MVSISDIVVISSIVLFTVIGLIAGIFKRIMGFVVVGVSFSIAYYVATPLSSLLVGTSMHETLVNSLGVQGAGWLIIAIMGIIVFLVVFILLKLLVRLINKGIEKGKILKFANRLIGGAFGLFCGLTIATVYLLILYGLAQVIPSVNEWYIHDLAIGEERFVLSRWLLDSIMTIFGQLKAA